jgi:cation transport ATPase
MTAGRRSTQVDAGRRVRVPAAIQLSRATERNLFWAGIGNVIAIPVAACALHPPFGLMLRPEFGALAISALNITVASNALLFRREVPAS